MTCATRGCPNPARWSIRAENAATRELRGLQTCDTHLDHSRRWAAAAGPPDVRAIEGAPDPDMPALF